MSFTDLGYTIEQFDLATVDDSLLEAVTALTNVIGVEREPRYQPMTAEEIRMFGNFPGMVRTRWVVRDNEGIPVALLSGGYMDDGTSPDILRVGMSVAEGHRRKGVGTELLRRAVGLARDYGRPTLSGDVHDTVPEGLAFATAVGAGQTMEFHMNSMRVSALDLPMLTTWRDDGPARAPGYSVRIIAGAYPEELLEGMAHLYLVLDRDMPHPESWEPRDWTADFVREMIGHLLQGTEALTEVAIHDDSRAPVGMSQLIRRTAAPSTWIVTTTMVDPDHRGHALGKWIKAAVALEALARWPGGEWMETGNAFTNEAMLGINHAMGFEHEFTLANVEVSVDRAEEYLRART